MAVRTAPAPTPEQQRAGAPVADRDRRAARVAVASLVALPLLVYGLPALLGHVVVPGDDLTQSLPLRELAGKEIAAGHLPVFDPYLWSGAPLLAGWNAGAAYPLTWLFAVLPAGLAWTVTLVSAVVAAGTGCYAFLRANRLGVVASWLGGATFAFGGGMSAQISHIGLVVGMAWVPLALLAVLRLTEPWTPTPSAGGAGAAPFAAGTPVAALAGWTAVLGGAVALVVVAGEPRAIANAAVVLILYGAWRVGRMAWAARRGERAVGAVVVAAAAVAAGAALGLGAGAVQLLPGLAAVATSQRAAVTSFLYGAGSLPATWLLLLGVPDLLGGSGSFGQPAFFAPYNLTEVTGYVGMLPLVAVGALLGRFRPRAPLPEWSIWYVVGAAGVLVSLGTHTPLWHVLIRIPLFGGQRLQSRSLLVVGLALAVLLAHWADGWIDGTATSRREKVLGTLLPACVVAVVLAAFAWRETLLTWMGVAGSVAARAGAIEPWLAPFLVLGAAAIALVWIGGRTTRTVRSGTAIVFVIVDLAVFAVTTVLAAGAPVPPAPAVASAAPSPAVSTRHGDRRSTGAARPLADGTVQPLADGTVQPLADGTVQPLAALHLVGRFAVYDPTLLDPTQLGELGVPDANVVTATSSAQGYGSIVDGRYAQATGTHSVSGTGQDVFSPEAADDGVFDALDVTDVLAPSHYLVSTVESRGSSSAAAAGRSADRTATPGRPATWQLGTPRAVAAVTVRPAPSTARSSREPLQAMRIGLERPDGRVDWAAEGAIRSAPGGMRRATWRTAVPAVAVVVATVRRTALAPPLVTTGAGGRLRPSGPLDAALVPPHWTYAGHDGPFAVYRNHRARPPLRLHALPGGNLDGARLSAVAGPALDPISARVSSPHGVTVIRAVAAIPGWVATWTPAGSRRAAPLPLRRDGVVQAVRAPPGRGTLTWRYEAPELATGTAVSVLSLAVLLALVALALTGASRRRRAGRAPSRPAAAP